MEYYTPIAKCDDLLFVQVEYLRLHGFAEELKPSVLSYVQVNSQLISNVCTDALSAEKVTE